MNDNKRTGQQIYCRIVELKNRISVATNETFKKELEEKLNRELLTIFKPIKQKTFK